MRYQVTRVVAVWAMPVRGGRRKTALVEPLTESRKKGWLLSERETGGSAVLARGGMPWRLCDVYQHATTRVALRLNHHCTDGCRLCRRLIACSSRAGPKSVLRYEECWEVRGLVEHQHVAARTAAGRALAIDSTGVSARHVS